LKQLQEESELEALRKQYEFHQCLKNREVALLTKYGTAQKKREERKRYLESNKSWDQDLDKIIAEVGFDKIRDLAPLHFLQSKTDAALHEHVKETIVPPINEQVTRKVDGIKESRDLLDSLLEEVVMMREAEYAGEIYMRDYLGKDFLGGSNPPSELSFNEEMEEWMGENFYDDEVRGEDTWRGEVSPLNSQGKKARGSWRKGGEMEGEDRDSSPPSLIATGRRRDSANSGSAASDEYEDDDEEPPLL